MFQTSKIGNINKLNKILGKNPIKKNFSFKFNGKIENVGNAGQFGLGKSRNVLKHFKNNKKNILKMNNKTQKYNFNSIKKELEINKTSGNVFLNYKKFQKVVIGTTGILGSISILNNNKVFASSEVVAPTIMEWGHEGLYSSIDAKGIRRGFEVFRQVCSQCHSLKYFSFRHLVGVSHTEEQMEKIAHTKEVIDGPNDEGAMFERPGRLADYWPNPYANDEFASYVNGGAAPPDLSNMVKARDECENYVYNLLIGYRDPPPGVELNQGNHFNPYFSGGVISMAPPLTEDTMVEYEDGVEPNVYQMAKDVSTFLLFVSRPNQDNRKKLITKAIIVMGIARVFMGYHTAFKWAESRTRKITFFK